MKSILDFLKNRKYALILLYWPIHSLWYELLRICYPDDSSVLIIESAWDKCIPFCEWFVIPYYSWYLCIAGVLIYTLVRCKREFFRASFLIVGCMLLPMIFCTLCPNGIDIALRPNFETLGRDNIATRLVQLIYAADTPARCVMPSMHVSVSFAMLFAVLKSKIMLKRPIYRSLAAVWCVAISLSTVFIKQHSILDVFAGIGTALLVLALALIAEKLYDKKYKGKLPE